MILFGVNKKQWSVTWTTGVENMHLSLINSFSDPSESFKRDPIGNAVVKASSIMQ